MDKKLNNIIFFDGVCNVCDKTVDFILNHDKKNKFFYSSLQSDFSEKFFKSKNENLNLESIVVFSDDKFLYKSKGIIYILKNIGGYPRIIGFLLGIFPKFISDYFYSLFAKYRYKLFGKMDICKIPTENHISRFYE